MIAEACVALGVSPEAFGVTPSPELGALMIEVLQEQVKDADRQERVDRNRNRRAG